MEKLNKFSQLSTTEKKQIRGGRAVDLIVVWIEPNLEEDKQENN